nr:hypothetical protein [Tanacetum cinerariifolium]
WDWGAGAYGGLGEEGECLCMAQGRMIREKDKDETINLVTEQGEVQVIAEPLKDDDDDATLAETLLNIKRSTSKR